MSTAGSHRFSHASAPYAVAHCELRAWKYPAGLGSAAFLFVRLTLTRSPPLFDWTRASLSRLPILAGPGRRTGTWPAGPVSPMSNETDVVGRACSADADADETPTKTPTRPRYVRSRAAARLSRRWSGSRSGPGSRVWPSGVVVVVVMRRALWRCSSHRPASGSCAVFGAERLTIVNPPRFRAGAPAPTSTEGGGDRRDAVNPAGERRKPGPCPGTGLSYTILLRWQNSRWFPSIRRRSSPCT